MKMILFTFSGASDERLACTTSPTRHGKHYNLSSLYNRPNDLVVALTVRSIIRSMACYYCCCCSLQSKDASRPRKLELDYGLYLQCTAERRRQPGDK